MNKHHRRWLCGALAAGAVMLGATGSQAASSRIALVVGDGQYAGQPALPVCSKTAHAVSAFLRQEGYIVNEAIDGSAVALRDALSDFAGRAAADHEPALVYVCAEATALDRRLFVLPSDVDLHGSLRPETQGIVFRALLNAMAGTQGIMVAELSLLPGADPTPVTAALQEALPDGLHLALTVGDGKQAGTLGNRLVNNSLALGQGWDRLAAALQGPSNGVPFPSTSRRPCRPLPWPQQRPHPPSLQRVPCCPARLPTRMRRPNRRRPTRRQSSRQKYRKRPNSPRTQRRLGCGRPARTASVVSRRR
jgi:hypothetical protein